MVENINVGEKRFFGIENSGSARLLTGCNVVAPTAVRLEESAERNHLRKIFVGNIDKVHHAAPNALNAVSRFQIFSGRRNRVVKIEGNLVQVVVERVRARDIFKRTVIDFKIQRFLCSALRELAQINTRQTDRGGALFFIIKISDGNDHVAIGKPGVGKCRRCREHDFDFARFQTNRSARRFVYIVRSRENTCRTNDIAGVLPHDAEEVAIQNGAARSRPIFCLSGFVRIGPLQAEMERIKFCPIRSEAVKLHRHVIRIMNRENRVKAKRRRVLIHDNRTTDNHAANNRRNAHCLRDNQREIVAAPVAGHFPVFPVIFRKKRSATFPVFQRVAGGNERVISFRTEVAAEINTVALIVFRADNVGIRFTADRNPRVFFARLESAEAFLFVFAFVETIVIADNVPRRSAQIINVIVPVARRFPSRDFVKIAETVVRLCRPPFFIGGNFEFAEQVQIVLFAAPVKLLDIAETFSP